MDNRDACITMGIPERGKLIKEVEISNTDEVISSQATGA